MKEFEGYVMLITGGGSGIGQETTRQFIEGGGEVVIADNRQEAIDQTLKAIGKGVSGKKCDVTSSKDIVELQKFVEENILKFLDIDKFRLIQEKEQKDLEGFR